MTDAELRKIQEEVGFGLPPYYISTMRDYPFAEESDIEFMLPDDSEEVINLNAGGLEVEGVECPFFVGSGDEVLYFVDAAEPMSPVYRSEGETGQKQIQAGSWSKFLGQIRQSRRRRGLEEAKVGAGGRWWPF